MPAAKHANGQVLMPSEVSSRIGLFDRFAGVAAHVASRAVFFLFCVLLVILWFPSVLLIHDIDTWQLIINTTTTIITFLMVALLQNSQTRSDQAVQHKLNAIAEGLAELMAATSTTRSAKHRRLEHEVDELRQAIGLEEHESTSNNAR